MRFLDAFRFDMLAQPWALLLLIPAGILLLLEAAGFAPGAVLLPTGETLHRLPRGRGLLLRRLPALLRAAGLSLLVVALAGPMNGFQLRRDRANVIDIMLCVDVSGSMQQKDFMLGGVYRDRLFVTKRTVHDFIEDRKQRREDRYGIDRLGLILYAGYAWTQCPLTLDYALLARELDLAHVDGTDKLKEGTAIGSAIGLAVLRLRKSETKSKVIILLTDGLNNRGELDPVTAAQFSDKFGVRVYTIGAGSTKGGAPGLFQRQAQPIDEAMLKKIAALTGGKYYRVTDTESLQTAYKEISELETTEIETGDIYEYRTAFMPWLTAGALLLACAVFLRRRLFDPVP
jgi:Ca-activated chloride channel homolog